MVTDREQLAALHNTAFACATLNASAMAAVAPRLYLANKHGAPLVVHDHPALSLLETVNPWMNGYDLLELTTLYLECLGRAFWLIEKGPFDAPSRIMPLAPQCLHAPSNPLGDEWEYSVSGTSRKIARKNLIHFSYPDPANPYFGGLSPLRGAWDMIELERGYLDFKRSVWRNRGVPGTILTPSEDVSPEEARRMEDEYTERFSGAQAGCAYVPRVKVDVHTVSFDAGDLSLLAEQSFTKEQICNAFGVPVALFSKETNLANMTASLTQHAILAIRPRLARRDSKLNEQYLPRFKNTEGLYFESPDPAKNDAEFILKQEEMDLTHGVRTVNEVRAARGLPPLSSKV